MKFSQRLGILKIKNTIQLDSIDDDLRIGLWNVLHQECWEELDRRVSRFGGSSETIKEVFYPQLWRDFFIKALDDLHVHDPRASIFVREWFFSAKWYEVYDFLEFVAVNFPFRDYRLRFTTRCNMMLKRELSGFRFVETWLTPITSEEELESIERAIENEDKFSSVRVHLKHALALLSDRKQPDYRNSIKESISAVEALCKLATDKSRATLDEALTQLSRQYPLHPAIRKAFSALYGYTSDADGIRHALLIENALDLDDAKFMLVCCSAFVNFVLEKISK